MVRPIINFYRVQVLETASVFEVDSCHYIHGKETIYCSKHESLKAWIGLQPGMKRRLECLALCFKETVDWRCDYCREDQHFCKCEIDEDKLVFCDRGVFVPPRDRDLPF